MKTWITRQRADGQPEPPELADQLGVTPRLSRVLWNRGLNAAELDLYLSPLLRHLEQPHGWPGVSDAAQLLVDGLLAGKKLAVWGDYDVDGITGTALVVQVLRHFDLPVEWHLPHRVTEGYGLNDEHVERLAASGIELLLTVDCGISDVQAVQRARDLGMTVVISDHHRLPNVLPAAHAVCNPQCGECPCPHLSGVGMAFFLMAEVNNRLALAGKTRLDMRETLDLVALGTLADMVPLKGQNRILVKNGLLKIAESRRPGMCELKVVSGFQPLAALSAGQVVFSLAPRVNAAGRMDDAALALELFTSADVHHAHDLARQLDSHNVARKAEEERITEEALTMAEAALADPALVLLGTTWNVGVIGIVASRLVERYHKPVMILGSDGENLKGSGRSIKGFNLHAGLAKCEDSLLAYGGHPMAAGVQVAPHKLADFRAQFLAVVREELGDAPVGPTLTLDGELDFAAASDFTFLKELAMMQPFGVGNPEPVFTSPPLEICRRSLFGPQRNHVKLELRDTTTEVTLQAKAWKQADTLPASLEGRLVRLAYSPSIDDYSGMPTVNVNIRDMEFL